MTIRLKKLLSAAVAALLLMALVGCGGAAREQGDPAASGDDAWEAALAYAECIRENGYPEWPDPNAQGQFMIRRDQGMRMNDPRRVAAMEACQHLRPSGSYGAGMGGMQGIEGEEALLAFAQCMRANGVPDFPDPSPGGGIVINSGPAGINPNSPRFQEALRICQEAAREGNDE